MSDSHLDTNQLLAHIEGDGGEPSFAKHLAHCDSCSGKLKDLVTLLQAFDSARLPELSPALVETTLARLRSEFAATSSTDVLGAAIAALAERLGRGFREFTASLVPETLTPSLQFRGGGPGGTQLYRTDDYELVIGVGQAGTKATALRGQVIPRKGSELPAHGRALLAQADTVLEAEVSEMGEFSFDPAPVDPASLAILLGEDLIRVDIG